jgi:hypothetical protein
VKTEICAGREKRGWVGMEEEKEEEMEEHAVDRI